MIIRLPAAFSGLIVCALCASPAVAQNVSRRRDHFVIVRIKRVKYLKDIETLLHATKGNVVRGKVTVRSAIIDFAANRLAADSRVRDEVVAQAAQNLEKVNAVLQKASELDGRIDAEQQKALAILEVDLDRVLNMVEPRNARRGTRETLEGAGHL